jgi:hypothetical protein
MAFPEQYSTEAILTPDCPSRQIFCVSFTILYVPVFQWSAKWIYSGVSSGIHAPKPATTVLFGLRICGPDRLRDRGEYAPIE